MLSHSYQIPTKGSSIQQRFWTDRYSLTAGFNLGRGAHFLDHQRVMQTVSYQMMYLSDHRKEINIQCIANKRKALKLLINEVNAGIACHTEH